MKSNFNHYLFQERSKLFAENLRVKLISNVMHSSITTALVGKMVAHSPLLIWLAFYITLSIGIFLFQKLFVTQKPYFNEKRWVIAQVACNFSTGFFWSLMPFFLFVPDNTFFIVCIMTLYAGYIAGSLSVNFSYKVTFIAFSIGASAPLLTRLLFEGGALYNSMAFLIVFFIAMLSYVSMNMHKLFLKSVEIQYENIQLVEKLAEEKAAVEKAVAAKNQFLAAASHDLRQPLNAISLFVDALKPLQTEPQGKRIISKIRQSLNGLNSMLHALLDISRLDAKVINNTSKHIHLQTLVKQLCEEYSHNAKGIKVINEITDDIIAFVDPTILYRILSNLLDNSVKYSNDGEITIFTSEHSDGFITLTVKDNGIGIPKEKIALVFDEFQQLNNPERDREKGLGLGLSIVKRLCHIADISLDITSEINQGTEVYMQLREGVNTAMDADETEDQHNNITILKDKNILVIDDEKHTLEGMQYLLSSYGCNVTASESLASAQKNSNKYPIFQISLLVI